MKRVQLNIQYQPKKRSDFLRNAHSFFVLYFEHAKIHGFSYVGLQHLLLIEKYALDFAINRFVANQKFKIIILY